MMNHAWLRQFVRLSNKYGCHEKLVQGAGGNTSVKLGDGTMLVKASGGRLFEIDEDCGWVKTSVEPIVEFICRSRKSTQTPSGFDQALDDELAEFVDSQTLALSKNAKKASIESGMHVLFKKFVVHIHPAELNALLTTTLAEKIIKQIFSEVPYLWIGAVPPGYYLAKAISDAVGNNLDELPSIIFLENHGIIVHAASASELEDVLDLTLNKVSSWLHHKLPGRRAFTKIFPWKSELSEMAIFPDTIVFESLARRLNELEPSKAQSIEETFAASAYMRSVHRDLKIESQYLSPEICSYILGMGREKHRQRELGAKC
jgi:rhamnose utilization protein RhaD (predicted bifunctional aldolase and dehydrogenase)